MAFGLWKRKNPSFAIILDIHFETHILSYFPAEPVSEEDRVCARGKSTVN